MTSPLPDSPFIRTNRHGALARITLDRPAALNACNLGMFVTIEAQLAAWAADASVGAIAIDGAGRAFCAGGDIRMVRDAVASGDFAALETLYTAEYRANVGISRLTKPYLALIDGICMGGGMGLAIHGSHRIVTERAVMAMPETAIGFFPDVGCTHVLPNLAGRVGWYLGLTGARLDAGDAMWCGLATHFIPHDDLAAYQRALYEDAGTDAAAVTERFAQPAPGSDLACHANGIARCFAGPTLADVFASLAMDDTPWAEQTLAVLRARSPLGLAWSWALMTQNEHASLGAALATEQRAGAMLLAEPDFSEGVRAVVVDKDQQPRWQPDRVEVVDLAAVERAVAACAREGAEHPV